MGMRRRRKKLTNVISTMDKKLRATSLRQVKRVTAASSDVTEEAETTTPASSATPPVGTQISVVTPDQWAKVIGGYYYPPNKTGGLGQVELFLEENLQLSVSDDLYVSGVQVKWNFNSGTPSKNYSGSFYPHTSYENSASIRKVLKYGDPSWTGRGTTSGKPTYRAIPPGVSNSIIYTVLQKTEIPNSVAISFRARIASYYATTTTATITFTAAHYFLTDQIVDVSSLGSPMADVDGIVKITDVPSTTQISYEFVKPRSASISNTVVSDEKYVYGVVSKYTTVGSSWIDPTTKKVFIWDGLRWAGYTDALEEGIVTNDGLPPAAPTSLNLSSLGYAEDSVLGKVSKSSVALSWTGPTTNSTGGSLNDLAGYRIWYSTTSSTGPWIGKQNFGLETEQTIIGLIPELTYYFKVIAFDTYGLDSTGLDGNILTVKTALAVEKPSAPILTSRLGTIKALWNGKDYDNVDTPQSILAYVEVHYSTSTGFTPSSSTLLGTISGANGFVIASDLEYDTDYYFKFIAVDINKRSTAASNQSTAKVTPLVDADLIAANLNSPLSVWPFAPKAVTAGALADGALDASSVFGSGVIVQSAIAANAIGANQIAANAITAGKIEAGAVTAAKIEALAISADKIAANAITTDKIQAGSITTEKLIAGTLTGFTVKTSDGSSAVRLDGSVNSLIIKSGGVDMAYLTAGYDNVYGYGTTWGITGSSYQNGTYHFMSPEAHIMWTAGGGGTSGVFYLDADGGGFGGTQFYFSSGVSVDQDITITGRVIANFTLDVARNLVVSSAGYINAIDTYFRNTTGGLAMRVATNGTYFSLTSSRRFKQDIADYAVDVDALLQMRPVTYRYIQEVEERGDEAGTAVGFIAEELHDLGLTEYLVYDLDENGNTVPQGISYDLLVVGLQNALVQQNQKLTELSDRLTTLENN